MSLNLLQEQWIPVIQLLILLKHREAKWLAPVHMASHKAEHRSKAATYLQTRASSSKPGHFLFIYCVD